MSHRKVIQRLIVAVIVVVVCWSVTNVSDYAYRFHQSWVVWSLGLALGTANALSVYAFVIARSRGVQAPAVVGILLFGGMSGALQTLLYLVAGAPLLAALAFGWFGPAAEGVLAWLHAALSEEEAPRRGRAQAKAAQRIDAPMQRIDAQVQKDASELPDKDRALALHSEGYSPAEVARLTGRNYQTVQSWIRRSASHNGVHTNGGGE